MVPNSRSDRWIRFDFNRASEKLKHIEPIKGTVTFDWINHPVFRTSIISTIIFSAILVIIGLVYSLRSPQRGIQDYAAGTMIMPH